MQRGSGGIGDDFGIDALASPQLAKDDGFAASATSALAPDALGAEVRLVDFETARKRRLGGTFLRQADADTLVDGIDRAHG